MGWQVLRWAPRFRLRANLLALVAIAALDLGVVGQQPLVLHGVADEIAHTLTAFIWYTAGVAIGLPIVFAATIVGTVALDIDHLPLLFGWIGTPLGTSRPGSHSLLPVLLILLLAAGDRARRGWWASVALGVLCHLWRDLGTGHVALLWPFSSQVVSIPYGIYLAGLAVPFLGASLWTSDRGHGTVESAR